MHAAFHFLIPSGLLPPVPPTTPARICHTLGACPGGAGISWEVCGNPLGAVVGGRVRGLVEVLGSSECSTRDFAGGPLRDGASYSQHGITI